jgi:hypothetical protein
LGASSASAQSCVGLPSFEGHPFRINAAAEFPEAAKAYAIGVGVGRANGPFLNAGAWQASYDDFDEKATIGFGEVGWQIPLGPAQLCPLAGGTYGTGPNDDLTGEEITSWSAIGGAAIGYPIEAGPVQIIPNGGFRFEHLSYTIKTPLFEDFSDTANSKVVDLGLALVFANRFSVQPLVHIPVGSEDEDSEASFGVFVSLALP